MVNHQFISTAAVPVIKLEIDKETYFGTPGTLHVDITLTDFSSDPYFKFGFETIEYVLTQNEETPHVREIVLVIKHLLET